MATRARPVIHGQTVWFHGFCGFLTHGGRSPLQYDGRLGPVFEDLEPAHESSSDDIEQTVSQVKWRLPEVRE